MSHLRKLVVENQISVVLAGIVAGILVPGLFEPLHNWNTLFLQLIFFFSALRVDMRELTRYARDTKMDVLVSVFHLIIFPVLVFLPLQLVAPDWSLAFLITLSVPTGMTIALMADYFGGKTSLAIVITIMTSVLAPFTMPVLFSLLVGRTIPIDSFGMLRDLLWAIVLPFALAWLLHRSQPKIVERGANLWRTASIVLFGILIASIVSKTGGQEGALTLTLSARTLVMIGVSALLMVGLVYLSYRMVFWRSVSERMTIALCMVYLNNTLSLYIADRFFADQHIVPQLVVILLLLNAMLPGFKFFAYRLVRGRIPGSAQSKSA